MLLGTSVSVFGLAALTVPCLASQYYVSLGMDRPLLSRSYIENSIILTLGLTSKPHEARILSPAQTLITHMFHHTDFKHWLSNTYGLLMIGTSLDLGLFPTLTIFIGGGLTGVLFHILSASHKYAQSNILDQQVQAVVKSSGLQPEQVVNTVVDHPITSWLVQTVSGGARRSLRDRIERVCGASAGVYALAGVEVVKLSKGTWRSVRRWVGTYRRRTRYGGSGPTLEEMEAKEVMERQLWSWLVAVMGHGVGLGYQIFVPQEAGQPSIGHAAHLGGFVFGLLSALYFV